MKWITSSAIAAMALSAIVATKAEADTFHFYRLTNTNVEDVGAQLTVDVTSPDATHVAFMFTNAIEIASSITEIYFDEGITASPLAAGTITTPFPMTITDSGAGVAFSNPSTPTNLPSGNTATPAFNTSVICTSTDCSPPPPADPKSIFNAGTQGSPDGVNSALEWVTLTFALASGQSFANLITAIGSGALRIGLHVQSIGVAGGSDSYINNLNETPTPIPLPPALLLFGGGLAGLGLLTRRRRRIEAA